jgi:hypothetical protein
MMAVSTQITEDYKNIIRSGRVFRWSARGTASFRLSPKTPIEPKG